MDQIFLNNTEDQTSSITIDGETFAFHFYPFRDLMYVDIYQSDELIVAGKRVMANRWLIPEYFVSEMGNLRFETYRADGKDYVWWDGFNVKFRLMAYSASEIETLEDEA